ncbi:MarR family winged helix-turn-helix transcriptional regulator [Cochlodiniinecator piscidefendens]|uniref:MarR family winged helix-turn-helix transcriptional regulator n=1 Tax=Cochlodiniinecator piscidefendens TaxID=2715756 RepID=UPI001E47D667|nr:MarR family winged helix-turn-helix transcriptional regulator [Cochlodiniinecator piscidefendens]
MTDFVLEDFLPYQLAAASSRVSAGFAEIYKQKFGISLAEWRLVAHLSQTSAVSVREIHNRIDMDKSKISRAATRLEASGHVTKRENSKDRRLIELALTQKGRDMMEELTPLARQYEQEVLQQLGQNSQSLQPLLKHLLNQPT